MKNHELNMSSLICMAVCILLGISSCSNDDNEKLTPSDPENFVEPLKGNQEYDKKIWDLFNKTGVCIRYKFSYEELNRCYTHVLDTMVFADHVYLLGKDNVFLDEDGENVTIDGDIYKIGTTVVRNTAGRKETREITISNDTVFFFQYCVFTTSSNDGYLVGDANEAYVGEQLNLLETIFLNYYTDDFLKSDFKYWRIMLCDTLQRGKNFEYTNVDYRFNVPFMEIGYGNERIKSLDEKARNNLKNNINYDYLKDLNLKSNEFEHIEFPKQPWKYDEFYGAGIVGLGASKKLDYLKMIITTPYEKLIEEPESADFNEKDFTGCLNPKKDVNGWIKKGYDALVNDYKSLGVDLQKIGNREHVR